MTAMALLKRGLRSVLVKNERARPLSLHPLRRLPEVHYEAHPAYGYLFSEVTDADRHHAQARFDEVYKKAVAEIQANKWQRPTPEVADRHPDLPELRRFLSDGVAVGRLDPTVKAQLNKVAPPNPEQIR